MQNEETLRRTFIPKCLKTKWGNREGNAGKWRTLDILSFQKDLLGLRLSFGGRQAYTKRLR